MANGATYGDAGRVMDVDHALGVGSRRVDGRVQHETGDVDSEVRCSLFDQVALCTINKMLKKKKNQGYR